MQVSIIGENYVCVFRRKPARYSEGKRPPFRAKPATIPMDGKAATFGPVVGIGGRNRRNTHCTSEPLRTSRFRSFRPLSGFPLPYRNNQAMGIPFTVHMGFLFTMTLGFPLTISRHDGQKPRFLAGVPQCSLSPLFTAVFTQQGFHLVGLRPP